MEENLRKPGKEEGCLKPLTNKDPEIPAPDPKQGFWQKLRSSAVPLLCVIVGGAILVTVIIILAALLSVRASPGNDKDPASTEETPKTEVVKGSPAAVCMDDWILSRGKWYYFSDQIDTWNNSQKFCKSHNSSLAIIENEKELTFLNLMKSNNYWIGLSRTQDNPGWVWTNGTFFSETMFTIKRKPTDFGAEGVFLNENGFISKSGEHTNKWICSKRL